MVEDALALYPGDATLVRIQGRVRSAKAAADREQAIRNIAAQGEELLAKEKFPEAAQLLDMALREHGNEVVLMDLRSRIELAWVVWMRDEVRQATIANVRRLLQKGNVTEAISSIQQALTAHPADSELLGLLSSAQKRLADRQRVEAVGPLSEPPPLPEAPSVSAPEPRRTASLTGETRSKFRYYVYGVLGLAILTAAYCFS